MKWVNDLPTVTLNGSFHHGAGQERRGTAPVTARAGAGGGYCTGERQEVRRLEQGPGEGC